MAAFAKAGFNAVKYASFRPTYPDKLFQTVLSYHKAHPHPSSTSLLDLGTGHGLISRYLSPNFTTVYATDPSLSMITQAKSSTASSQYPNIEFRQASAEDLSFIPDGSVDMVVSGQAAHWFEYSKVWPELAKKVRKGGTLAFWGYKDNVFPSHPKATAILDHYCYGEDMMGPYWEQPGRNILRDKFKAILPPETEWEDIQRITYEPGLGENGKGGGEGEVLMGKKLTLKEVEGYVRTFSAVITWLGKHKERCRMEGGEGDVVDRLFDEMREAEEEWKETGEEWREVEVDVEWGSVILMARRK